MRRLLRLRRDTRGATVIEMAFALPAMIIMMWAIVQLGLVFRAMSGIQHALGQGARLATLFPQPDNDAIQAEITDSVYGIGPGTFTIADPVAGIEDGTVFLDLQVSYTQSTDLLLLPGPDITVSRSKRVWVAGT
ncbi:MAG TPA: TadE family protein [Sphingomicrobium sp.]|nr:TadE family protein [Sphingomicrobium sp.]